MSKNETIKAVLANRAAAGRPPGPVPLGYRFDDNWQIVPDPYTTPLVRQAFELAANGELPLRAILAEMTRLGLYTRKGRQLGVSGLWTILTNPFYTGQIWFNGHLLPGAQEAVIDKRAYQEVQQMLRRRSRRL